MMSTLYSCWNSKTTTSKINEKKNQQIELGTHFNQRLTFTFEIKLHKKNYVVLDGNISQEVDKR